MGLRSNFPRVDKDFYRTPVEAIGPLLPHLPKGVRYAEPCAGDGALVSHLAPHANLAWACDIEPKASWIPPGDALSCRLGDAKMWITNPPWTRKVLHPLIVHLSDQAPTWLLFDSNWINTRQAAPFMERCRRIVAVGRLKWIAGSPHAGKDDASWFLFDRPLAASAPVFFGRDCPAPETAHRPRRVCYDCGILIDRFGKWALQSRNGIPTPVHLHCDNPSSRYALADQPVAPAPLLDWIAAA